VIGISCSSSALSTARQYSLLTTLPDRNFQQPHLHAESFHLRAAVI
jgi:hypothetical protein